jgi:putative ABC transport system permease protein
MSAHRVSRALYRRMIRLYPADFRERFGGDLERDFADLLTQRGVYAAWRRVSTDWSRSLTDTHAYAHGERRRLPIPPPGERPMSSLMFDVRHAVRSLSRAPIFTGVTVLTLALGIGANSAIFSLVNAVLIRPVGYHQPERLMMIYEGIPEANIPRFGVSPADFIDLTDYQQSFTEIGAYRNRPFELSGTGEPQEVNVAQMTSSLFSLLGVNAAMGRVLTEADTAERMVAVLSHGLWQSRFGGRDVLGERITLNRTPYTVVGVMPASFQFPRRGPELNGEPADLWVPLVFNPFERQARGMFYNHSVLGRLKDGRSQDQAATETGALASRIRENYPALLRNSPFSLVVMAVPLLDELSGQVRQALLLLLGAVGLVLLVACANVANLMLSRAVVREREIGLRTALGAARYRLFRMVLTESLLLTLAAGAVGLVLGYWTIRAMPTVIATSLPGVSDVALDGRVIAFTFAVSVITALIFSLAPLHGGATRDVNDLLREGTSRTSGGIRQHRVQAGLVITSVAFAFVLLVGAGLLIRSLNNLLAVDSGIRADNVMSMKVSLPPAGYANAPVIRAFYRNLHERLRALPGVRSASISSDLPLEGDGERRAFTPERVGDVGGTPPSVAVTWTHGQYFETFGIPIVRGRSFSPEEEAEPRPVAIVSRGLAGRFWPGEDPIGKRVKWGVSTATTAWMTVVGVAGDVVDGALGAEPIIHIYVPYTEIPDQQLSAPTAGLLRRMTVAVHGDLDAVRFAVPTRTAIAALDPALAVTDVMTLEQVISDASAPKRFSAMVLGAFAAGALLLAGIGLYGVLAFGVAQRQREIGVRLALGAEVSEVMRLILRQGMGLTAIGLLLGAIGAAAAAQLLRSQLYDTAVYDVWTFAAVPVVLAVVALLACFLPARRAASVDPMVALRVE